MSITSEVNKVIYTCNNSTVAFAYTFKIFDDDEIEVILYTVATGVEAVLVKDTHYTVTGVGNDIGGTITTVATYTSAYKLILRRKIALTQIVDYIENDDFPAESHEEAMDRIVMMLQQQEEKFDRVVLRDASQSDVLTSPSPSANKVIGWNAAGTGLENKTEMDVNAQATAAASASAAQAAQAAAEVAQAAAEDAADEAEAVAGFSVDTDGTLAANSDAVVPSQKAAKTYADTKVPGDGTVGLYNLVHNGDFELWFAGAIGYPPTEWTWNTAGGSIAREATIVKLGSYSAKLTRATSYAELYRLIAPDAEVVSYWRGRKVTFGCWVWCATANSALITIGDSDGAVSSSAYHPGDSAWHFLTVTRTVGAAATQLYVDCLLHVNSSVAYFDGACAYEGAKAFAYSPAPKRYGTPVDRTSNYPTVGELSSGGLVCVDGVGNGSIYGYTDANADPTTRLACGISNTGAVSIVWSMPVQKGHYWKLAVTGAGINEIYFLPEVT